MEIKNRVPYSFMAQNFGLCIRSKTYEFVSSNFFARASM